MAMKKPRVPKKKTSIVFNTKEIDLHKIKSLLKSNMTNQQGIAPGCSFDSWQLLQVNYYRS